MSRDGFVFYRSFWECISELDADTQAAVIKALCEYALDDKEPTSGGIASAIFRLMKPQIDANNKRYENGKKGGRPKTETADEETKQKPNKNQTITKDEPKKTEAEPKEKDKVKDKEKDKDKDKDKVKENIKPIMRTGAQGVTASQMVIDHGFNAPVQAKVLDWIKYKTEKRQGYKETGLKSLLTVVQRQIDLYGESAVIRCIEDSMAAGWKGIAWGRIESKPKEKKDRYEEIRSWFSEGTA